MRLFGVRGAISLALAAAVWSGAALAATGDAPQPADLVFEHEHLANMNEGQQVGYKFERKVSDPKVLGEGFSDEVTVKVVDVADTGKKTVDLQIYTGDRARELQKLPNLTINPIFLVYLEQAVNTYHNLSGGKRAYLKRVFSMSFKDEKKATIEPVKIDYEGKTVDGYRISLVPYKGDRNASKMDGWDDSRFIIVVSDSVPGEVVQLLSQYENAHENTPKLEERYTLNGVKSVK